jgi:hypothetical protein
MAFEITYGMTRKKVITCFVLKYVTPVAWDYCSALLCEIDEYHDDARIRSELYTYQIPMWDAFKKERARAATVIQRHWKNRMYLPEGPLAEKARVRFAWHVTSSIRSTP